MLSRTMNLSAGRFGRYLKAARAEAHRRLDNRRNSHQGYAFGYLAIHDGRTLNACVPSGTGPVNLQLVGADAVPLPAPSVEGTRRVWVVDLLGLELPAGTYRLCAVDQSGEQHSMFPPPKARPVNDEPMLDGQVSATADVTAELVEVDRAVGIEIARGDDRPRVAALNFCGPEAYRIQVWSASGSHRIVATEREGGNTVDLGQVVDGVGTMRVTSLSRDGSEDGSRWDLALQDETGERRTIYGPGADYNRPDWATSYGDISFIHCGVQDRWKPYVTRDGRLAIHVTAESRTGTV